jgi:hypothetical protein
VVTLVGNYDLTEDSSAAQSSDHRIVPQAKYASLMAATPWFDTFEFHFTPGEPQPRSGPRRWRRLHPLRRQHPRSRRAELDRHTGQAHGVLFGRWQEVEGQLGSEYAPDVVASSTWANVARRCSATSDTKTAR